jgi:hypothetical protein
MTRRVQGTLLTVAVSALWRFCMVNPLVKFG